MNRIFSYLFPIVLLFASQAVANTSQYINEYGQLPKLRSFSISPDGKHYSYIVRGEEYDRFVVINSETEDLIFAGNATKFKARSISFVTDKHVLLRGSDTRTVIGYRGRFENSGTLAYNIETGKIKVLLKGTKKLHPAQGGLGKIVGLNSEDEVVYMPAFTSGSNPANNLYKVSLNSGKGRIHAKGNPHTVDWFVGKQGEILAREEYNEKRSLHIIRSKLSGKWVVVYSNETPIPEISVQAVGADGKSLLFVDANDDHEALYSMSLLDGAIAGPVFSRQDADIDHLVMDINSTLQAVVYSGFKPAYEFVDQKLNKYLDRLEVTFPASSVYLKSWDKEKKSIILYVSGGDAPGSYYLFDSEKVKLKLLGSKYDVPSIGEIKAVRYTARDGLKIPAVITFPLNTQKKRNLPLIALPHGGPESYDRIGFDWLAQYFAMKGYVVLQPNFRGSMGFGYDFRNAGRGRWGREMQNDVSDGITTLIESGYVDPSRVCIVGASYGGYSALAGGAFSPELYRCIISVNGVSDLPQMLSERKYRHGRNHWVISYWHELIGNSRTEINKLNSISPVNYAFDFHAPVLLIHGKDDTVVPIEQSERMYKALKKEGKSVEFISLEGEDHWLSTSATRLQMLTAIDNFLDSHNPVEVLVDKQESTINGDK